MPLAAIKKMSLFKSFTLVFGAVITTGKNKAIVKQDFL